jgi:hypothetical protein
MLGVVLRVMLGALSLPHLRIMDGDRLLHSHQLHSRVTGVRLLHRLHQLETGDRHPRVLLSRHLHRSRVVGDRLRRMAAGVKHLITNTIAQ